MGLMCSRLYIYLVRWLCAGWLLAGCWVGRVMGTSPGGVWGLGVKNVMENGIEIQNRLSHLLHYYMYIPTSHKYIPLYA